MAHHRSLCRGRRLAAVRFEDLGLGSPELGYAMLSEIEDARGKLGLPVERDLYFRAEHRLSTYAEIARRAGMIVT